MHFERMNILKITVDEQPKIFHLAFNNKDKWMNAAGHKITVGNYEFSATPMGAYVNVSEVTSGNRFITVDLNPIDHLTTATKEGTIEFYYEIGKKIRRILLKQTNFDSIVAKARKAAIEKFGEMPPFEDFDEELIFERMK